MTMKEKKHKQDSAAADIDINGTQQMGWTQEYSST